MRGRIKVIHQTNIYQIEYEKYLFFKRIKIFLISFLLCFAAALFMKVLTRGAELASNYSPTPDDGFKYTINDDGTATVTGISDAFSTKFPEGNVVIPEKVEYNGTNYSVTAIGNKAFKDNNDIVSVTGEFITEIDDAGQNDPTHGAFWNCSSLKEVHFKNLTYLGDCAFYGCSNLLIVELPKALTIGYASFNHCNNLEEISLPEALYAALYAFAECQSLHKVYLPKSQYVAAFQSCPALKEVFLPEAIYLGYQAFYNDGSLEKVDIPKASYISKSSFGGCYKLLEVNAPSLVYCEENIEMFASIRCANFKLPKSMKNYGLESNTNAENMKFEYIYDAPTTAVINQESELDAKIQEIKNQYMKKYNLENYNITLSHRQEKKYKIKSNTNSQYYVFSVDASNYDALSGLATSIKILILQTDVSADMTVRDAEYDGNKHKPTVSISMDGDYALQEGEDYKITGDFVNAGEQTATLEFIGMYKGMDSITKTFTITPKNATNFDVEYEKVHIYDGKQPEFKIKDGEKELVLGTDYKIVSDKDIKEIGTHNVKIQYIGNYTGEKDIEFEVVADKSNWGEEVNNGGVINYVDSHGKTSAEVTGEEMIWLKESSDGTSAWYAIDNTNGTFKQGSRFWTQWLSPEANKEEFEKYYNKLDDEHKNQVENNKLWIFLTGVTDPDGNDYTNLDETVNYYIQLGEDWDEDDVKAVFISDKNDDVLQVLFEDVNTPEGTFKCAKILMQHFSPYAVYDPIDSTVPDTVPDYQKKEPEEKQKNDNNESLIPNDDKNSNNGKNFLINPTKENFGQAIKSGLITKISILFFLILIPSALIFNKIIKKAKINKD